MTKKRILDICEEIDSLKDRFGFSDDDWREVDDEIRKIRKRCQDAALYLGVVGEFSCGKSTFINALLGLDLLKEDILQGTTCAPTFVRSGKMFDVVIHAGRNSRLSDEIDFGGLGVNACIEKAREAIYRYTADEMFASRLKSVEIFLPVANALFEKGVVLVDTPGINAENPRHQKVAEETVRKYCDTVLILTPSNIPCSQTLVGFVRDKIGTMASRCVGIATCIDRLRPRERYGTIKYIRSRFESEGCALADVHGVAARFVAHPDLHYEEEETESFCRDFGMTVSKLVAKVESDRLSIVTAKLGELIEGLVNTRINGLLDRVAGDLSRRKANLEKCRLRDMNAYLEERRRQYCNQVGRHAPTPLEVREAVDMVCDIELDAFNYRLYAARNLATLKERTTEAAVSSVLAACREKTTERVAKLAERTLQWAQDAMEELNDDFNAEFRSLGGDAGRSVDRHGLTGDMAIDVAGTCRGDIVDAIVPQEALKVGGAIVGVVVGSILLPGIGTILGGVAGNFFGTLFGKSLDDHKREAEATVKNIVNGWKPTLVEKLTDYACRIVPDDISKRISACIGQYESVRPQVERVIEDEVRQQKMLEELIAEVNSVKKYLSNVTSGAMPGGALT